MNLPAPKTTPLPYQLENLEQTWRLTEHGWRWPTGTRKTWQAIMTAAWQYSAGLIDAVLVVAPPGVDLQWMEEQLPLHLPDEVAANSRYLRWQSSKSSTKYFTRDLDGLLAHQGLAWFITSFPSWITKAHKAATWRLLSRRRVLFILDQSLNIKTPGAARTKSVVAAAKHAPYRRILEGTLTPEGPFDLYSQLRFLAHDVWRPLGIQNNAMYKAHFGTWITAEELRRNTGFDPGYDKLTGYRNLEQLGPVLAAHTSWVDKAVLNLPPETTVRRPHALAPAHRAAYDKLRDEMLLELRSGRVVEPTLAIVLMIRLQQVSRGYVGVEAGEPIERIPGSPAALGSLEDLISEIGNDQVVIWARFREDIRLICETFGPARALPYDGSVDSEARDLALRKFKAGDLPYLVANPSMGSTGLNLQNACYDAFYSYGHRLVHYTETKDRIFRSGQKRPVTHTILVADHTIDDKVLAAWARKQEVAAQIDGAALRTMLEGS